MAREIYLQIFFKIFFRNTLCIISSEIFQILTNANEIGKKVSRTISRDENSTNRNSNHNTNPKPNREQFSSGTIARAPERSIMIFIVIRNLTSVGYNYSFGIPIRI